MTYMNPDVDTNLDSRSYEIALSFAGEQREFVAQVAERLVELGVRVFYDDYEKEVLWGKDLYEHLAWVYSKAARYCILFISFAYANRVWTTHERRNAQERALQGNEDYILPVRFDDTEIPGLRSTVAYLDATKVSPRDIADFARKKLGSFRRKNYLPKDPDLLFRALNVQDETTQDLVTKVSETFIDSLSRATVAERRLVFHVFQNACPADFTKPHLNLDRMRREIGVSSAEIVEAFRGLSSLGFQAEVRELSDHHADSTLYLRWRDLAFYGGDKEVMDFATENDTIVAVAMVQTALGHFCPDCQSKLTERLDFSQLSSREVDARS